MKLKSIYIDSFTWKQILVMIEQNQSINDILDLLEDDKNEDLIDQIKYQLLNGIDIKEIISKFKDPISTRLLFLLKFTSFSKALKSAISFVAFEKELKQKLLKSFLYPSIMLMFSIIILLGFTYLVFPKMLMIINNNEIMLVISLLKILSNLIGLVLLIITIVLLVLVINKQKFPYLIYKFINVFNKDNFIKEYITYIFFKYFIELYQSGISTKQIFKLLTLTNKPIISLISQKYINKLEKGDNFEEIINDDSFDLKLRKFIKFGIQTNNFKNSIENYLSFIELKIIKSINKLNNGIQIVAYSFIGLIVVIVYQAMIMPLSLLEGL